MFWAGWKSSYPITCHVGNLLDHQWTHKPASTRKNTAAQRGWIFNTLFVAKIELWAFWYFSDRLRIMTQLVKKAFFETERRWVKCQYELCTLLNIVICQCQRLLTRLFGQLSCREYSFL
jgi:hypothetical protein